MIAGLGACLERLDEKLHALERTVEELAATVARVEKTDSAWPHELHIVYQEHETRINTALEALGLERVLPEATE